MTAKIKTAITPTREENYSEWYQSVLKAADLAEHSEVRGCMVIKPWGFAIWENIQKILDAKFKETGHQNAYFPLFIPLSYFEKEAEHVEGFAKECAVVTHHKLEKQGDKLVPAGKLEEPLIVRPTSEMVIGHAFARWVESYRDLPLLINQWCNIVRWEMRTRIFLRTAEILWQEGHTVHASSEEAKAEALQMIHVYSTFCQDVLAIPVIVGQKTESEKFPGAVDTYTIEAMMQDRKAIQAGTSHFLGQNFAKACNVVFQNRAGEREYGWMTSWGSTTRLIGGMIMTHSDDDGLVLPPRIASAHLVILPIIHNEEERDQIIHHCHVLKEQLKQQFYQGEPLRIIVDEREMRGGEKKWSWVKKGVPLRLEVGPKEIAKGSYVLFRRDQKEAKIEVDQKGLSDRIAHLLEEIQTHLFKRALAFRAEHTKQVESKEVFYQFFAKEESEISGGFVLACFSEDEKIEAALKNDLGVTIRCIPLDDPKEGTCIFTGKPNARRMLFARAY